MSSTPKVSNQLFRSGLLPAFCSFKACQETACLWVFAGKVKSATTKKQFDSIHLDPKLAETHKELRIIVGLESAESKFCGMFVLGELSLLVLVVNEVVVGVVWSLEFLCLFCFSSMSIPQIRGFKL